MGPGVPDPQARVTRTIVRRAIISFRFISIYNRFGIFAMVSAGSGFGFITAAQQGCITHRPQDQRRYAQEEQVGSGWLDSECRECERRRMKRGDFDWGEFNGKDSSQCF